MADFGAPVAQNVNVNPAGGLQTISSLLSIQQQKQALQGQAAQVQQEQQSASQRSGIAHFIQNFDPTQHVGPDGTLDLDGIFSDPKLRQAAGDQFPQLMQQMLQIKQGQLSAKQQLVNLNDSTRTQFQGLLGGLRTDPDVMEDNLQGRQKVQQAIGQFAATGPDATRIAQIYGSVFDQVPRGKLGLAVNNSQLQAMDAANQAGRQAPSFADTGSSLVQTNPQAAGGGTQGNLRKDLAPTDQPAYKANVAGQTAAASTRASGVGSSDIDRANQISAQVQPSKAAIQTTQQIDDLADQIHSGKFSKAISQAAAAMGFKEDTYARQILNKDLGIVRTQFSASAGSDARASTILSQFPDDTSDPQTIHAAMDYVRGTARQNVARADQLNAFRTKRPDLSGFQHADDVLTGSVDPLMNEYGSLKTPAARQGFLRRNFTSGPEAQQFVDKLKGAQHVFGP